MSQYSQSHAAIVKVKGVSFNYVQFLWSGIAQVKQAQAKQMYSEGMRLSIELVNYLPNSLKDAFKNKVAMIQHTMTLIKTNSLTCLKQTPDFYIRGIFRNRILQAYAGRALSQFIDELSDKLNSMGYMENVEKVEEGQDDWFIEHKKQEIQRKRADTIEKKKKGQSKEAAKFENVSEG